ncbi:MAG: disulfide bond formation protein B [Candidatus Kerfeldbacteria bacterium]|nr:disulfide bond formation protein B [Candidatus Kerfeldbacteria bacterium]
MSTATVTSVLSILTIVGHVILVLAILGGLIGRSGRLNIVRRYFALIRDNALQFGFVVALLATAGSLYYSEVAHFTPCILCWYQRIVVYPQFVLFGIALIRKERVILPYAMALAVIGILIAAYQYGIQVSETFRTATEGLAPCSLVGYSPSCATKFVFQFGYITIPLMSFTASALLLLVSVVGRRQEKD